MIIQIVKQKISYFIIERFSQILKCKLNSKYQLDIKSSSFKITLFYLRYLYS